MDITVLAICILGISSFRIAHAASCVETLSRDSNYTACMKEYTTFQQSQDPSNAAQAMCSKQGRAKLACMLSYMKQCPDLKSAMSGGGAENGGGGGAENGGGGMGDVSQFMSPEGIETMCALMPGGGGGNECAEVTACANRTGSQFAMKAEPGPSPFSNFQKNIGLICGAYVKGLNMCFEKAPAECADFVKNMKKMIPRYEETNSYFKEKCPKVPKGFVTNTCIRENVESSAFLECYQPVDQAYNQDPNAWKNCTIFLMGKKCTDDNVGVKCEQASADAITAAVPLLIMGIPTTCLVTSAAGGGLEVFVTKALMMTTLLFAVFRHL